MIRNVLMGYGVVVGLILGVGLFLTGLLEALILALVGITIDFVLHFLLGWVLFLWRTIPHIAVSVSGVLTAVACVVVLVLGVQVSGQWLMRHSPSFHTNQTRGDRLWRWRWTCAILGVVVLMFMAGIAAIGVVHQTAWLATSSQPLLSGGIAGPASRAGSMYNLKQMGMATRMHQNGQGSFPAGGSFDAEGRMLHSWQTALLPFMEQEELYRRIRLDQAWNQPDNAFHFKTVIKAYLHPGAQGQHDESGFALSHYAGNVYVLGGEVPWKIKDITDGLSYTLLAGEAAGNFKPWGYPANWRDPMRGMNRSPDGFGNPSRYKERPGAYFALADGSARFVSDEASPELLKALATPRGGEPMPIDPP